MNNFIQECSYIFKKLHSSSNIHLGNELSHEMLHKIVLNDIKRVKYFRLVSQIKNLHKYSSSSIKNSVKMFFTQWDDKCF